MKQMQISDFIFTESKLVEITFTKRFPLSRQREMEGKIRDVLRHFPEITELKVGYVETSLVIAGRAKDQSRIWLRLDVSLFTIAHELTHLVQEIHHRNGTPKADRIPYGEKSCDLWTLARSNQYLDDHPSYLKLPPIVKTEWRDWKEIAHRLAKRAIEKRAEGYRQYLKWFEDQIHTLSTDKEMEEAYRIGKRD